MVAQRARGEGHSHAHLLVYDESMSEPDYVICLECESPTYTFEWSEGRIVEALCTTCGNDDPQSFATEEDYEELSGAMEEDDDA